MRDRLAHEAEYGDGTFDEVCLAVFWEMELGRKLTDDYSWIRFVHECKAITKLKKIENRK